VVDDRKGSEVGADSPSGELAFSRAQAVAEAEANELETRSALAGDPEAIKNVWRRHRRWVAAILLAHKPRWADLDDLLQDVALSVVRKVGELRDPRAVRPWLRTVAINAAHAAARSGQRRVRDVALGDDENLRGAKPYGPPSPEQEEGRRLMDLARRLPDGYREPLLLKAVHGLSYREIGRILGLPETTIETRIARGRRQLRELAMAENTGPLARVGEDKR